MFFVALAIFCKGLRDRRRAAKPAFIAIGKNSGTVSTNAGKVFMNMPMTT